MYEEELREMTDEELKKLLEEVQEELRSREKKELEDKVLITLLDEFNNVEEDITISGYDDITRQRGGWTKVVTGLDKTKTNGYSLLGYFVSGVTKKQYYKKGTIFVDCDIRGSVQHHRGFYRLFYLDKNGKMHLLDKDDTPDYAVNFWDKIEEHLKKD